MSNLNLDFPLTNFEQLTLNQMMIGLIQENPSKKVIDAAIMTANVCNTNRIKIGLEPFK